MKRIALAALLACALVVAALFASGFSASTGNPNYTVRAIFDDVASAVPGEDVRVAGAKVGKIGTMDVTPQKKASVVLHITKGGFTPWHDDAHCTIFAQSLIGEKYVSCTPGSPSRPALKKIKDGQPGAGQYLLPLGNTSAPVDIDLINDVMRMPYRQRFAIVLSELGAGLAGRGQDLNALLRRANPALRETDKVLQQLADENVTLKNLASESDQALGPLARDRRHLSGFIRSANAVGEATAARRADIERSIQKLPEFLRQLKPTMEDLGQLSDQMTPTLVDLDRAAPSLASLVVQLGPFSRSAQRSLSTLGDATDVGGPVLKRARPVVRDLRAFAHNAKPVAAQLDAVTASLDKTGGLEQAMNYIFFQMTAINGFDEISHYLRAALLVNTCSTYVTTKAAGCSANFSDTKSVRSSSASTAAAAKATRASTKPSAAAALAKLAAGVLNLRGGNSLSAAQQKAIGRAGVQRLREQVAEGSSPALKDVGASSKQQRALLSYLMGSN
jgi:ABC-type transporter Mla subunit MlaD